MIFTSTPDLTAATPPAAVREMGFTEVPLMSSRELSVKNSLTMCVRLLVHVDTGLRPIAPRHVYLRDAEVLRPRIR